MALVTTGFSAQKYGYRFPNYFELSLEFDLPLIGKIDLEDLVYGLCGGMCYSALDYFYAGLTTPQQRTIPQPDSSLHNYLWKRQLDSLRPTVLVKIMEWMVRGDADIAQLTAGREFLKLRRRLEKGQPAVLLLIRAGGLANPTRNHQVVAAGYELDDLTRRAAIHLYDPNYPGETPEITFSLANPAQGIDIHESTNDPLRGFFVLEYSPLKRALPRDMD